MSDPLGDGPDPLDVSMSPAQTAFCAAAYCPLHEEWVGLVVYRERTVCGKCFAEEYGDYHETPWDDA